MKYIFEKLILSQIPFRDINAIKSLKLNTYKRTKIKRKP